MANWWWIGSFYPPELSTERNINTVLQDAMDKSALMMAISIAENIPVESD